MKSLMLVTVVAMAAACSQADESAPIAEPTETSALAPAPILAADGQPAPGKYKITTSDGQVFNEEVKSDGTYTQSDSSGAVIETGTWEQKSPSEYCYTVDQQYREEGDSGEQQCNTEGIDAAGVWTSTNPKGQSAKVERVTS